MDVIDLYYLPQIMAYMRDAQPPMMDKTHFVGVCQGSSQERGTSVESSTSSMPKGCSTWRMPGPL